MIFVRRLLRDKIIIIKYFDELTKPAQYALRRKMETGTKSVRYILLVKCFNKIENSIKSRCLCIRCPRLTRDEIKGSLINLLHRNNLAINHDMIDKSVSLSQNIISNAIYYLTYMISSNNLDITCPLTLAVNDIKKYLYKTPLKYENIRECIATLQLSKISHHRIFNLIIKESINYFTQTNTETDSQYIYRVISLSSKYDLIASSTNKFGIAVESFIISVFNIIQEYKKIPKV